MADQEALQALRDGNWADYRKDHKNIDLSGADLRTIRLTGLDLSGANLSGADLRGANLIGANLSDCNLNFANLELAVFTNTNLDGADLRNANLKNASKLAEAWNFPVDRFGGSDVSGATLPENAQKFASLEVISSASGYARTIFLILLLACGYSLVAVWTTSDVGLITNSASTELPFIGTRVEIAAYYWFAPWLLIGVYIYFHLSMQRVWERFTHLPAVLLDGRAIDSAADPWLVTGMVRRHLPRLRIQRPALSGLESWIVIALAWLAVPVVIATLAWRYSYRHEWYGSGSHVAAFALAATFGMFSYFLARRTLRLEGASEREHAWRSRLGTVGLFALFLVFAFGPAWVLIEGIPGTVSPLAKAWLVDATISTKPEGWSPEDPTKGVVGAKLWRSNLRGALAASAFLVAADLRDADLRDAILWRADLKGAILQGADLWRADVRGAAQLPDADLRGANLYFSVLRGTRILTCQQLREAREWQHAYRDAELGCDAKIPSPPPEFPAPATGKSDG